MEIVRKVAMLSFVHAPEIEIFPSAKLHILSRNYFLKNTALIANTESGSIVNVGKMEVMLHVSQAIIND